MTCDCLKKHQNGGVCNCTEGIEEQLEHNVTSDWDNDLEDDDFDDTDLKPGRITRDIDEDVVQ